MSEQNFEYDAFLNYASKDTEWCEKLVNLLHDEGIRVWFDKWQLQSNDNWQKKIQESLKKSRKMIVVWSNSYFCDEKAQSYVENFSKLHSKELPYERFLIPICIIAMKKKVLLYRRLKLEISLLCIVRFKNIFLPVKSLKALLIQIPKNL